MRLDSGCHWQRAEKTGLRETSHPGHGWGTWSRAWCKVEGRDRVTVEKNINIGAHIEQRLTSASASESGLQDFSHAM